MIFLAHSLLMLLIKLCIMETVAAVLHAVFSILVKFLFVNTIFLSSVDPEKCFCAVTGAAAK